MLENKAGDKVRNWLGCEALHYIKWSIKTSLRRHLCRNLNRNWRKPCLGGALVEVIVKAEVIEPEKAISLSYLKISKKSGVAGLKQEVWKGKGNKSGQGGVLKVKVRTQASVCCVG